jgi:two-component system CheB/CheR fusion protein
VNSELQGKVRQVQKAHNEMRRMLDALDTPTIFVDAELRIRRFSSNADRIVELIDSDVGRPLKQLSSKVGGLDLSKEAQHVRDTMRPEEKEVMTNDGFRYLMRILPYPGPENQPSGVVFSFVDSSRLKSSAERFEIAEKARRYAESIVETVREPLIVLDHDLTVLSGNESFYRTFHLSEDGVEGKNFFEIGDGQWDIPALRKLLTKVLPRRRSFADFLVEYEFPSIGRKKMLLNARRMHEEGAARDRILLAIEDVTAQKAAERALRESETKYRDVVERASDGICILQDGLVKFVNLRGAELVGDSVDEILGAPFVDYIHPDDSDRLKARYEKRLSGEAVPAVYETVLRHRDGTDVPVELNAGVIEYDGREADLVILRDNTERKRTQDRLQQQEERLRMILEGAELGAWDRDMRTRQVVWNRRLYELLGRDPNGPPITEESFFSYIHKDDLPRVQEHLTQIFRGEDEFKDEFRIVRDDGEVRWLAAAGKLYRDADGKLVRMSGINADITERKVAEELLAQERNELELQVLKRTAEVQQREQQYKHLANRLVDLLEKDRRDVAMSLHDEVGQILTILKMELEAIETHLRANDLRPVAEEMSGAKQKTLKAIVKIKELSKSLRPQLIETLGLVPSVRAMVNDIKKPGSFTVNFFCEKPDLRSTNEKELALYRITQEALTNILKHASAKEVFLSIVQKDDSLLLTVEDDGKGFDYDKVSKSDPNHPDRGLGLMIMKERAAQVGGDLRVESAPGKGTNITAEVPL